MVATGRQFKKWKLRNLRSAIAKGSYQNIVREKIVRKDSAATNGGRRLCEFTPVEAQKMESIFTGLGFNFDFAQRRRSATELRQVRTTGLRPALRQGVNARNIV